LDVGRPSKAGFLFELVRIKSSALFSGKHILPEIHRRSEHQRGDDRALAQRPFRAADERDDDAQHNENDVDLLPELAHGGADAVGNHLDAALHGRAHQAGFQHQRAAECADKERQHAHDHAQWIEGEAHIPEHRVQEEIEYGAAEGDVKDLQQLGLAEVLSFHGDLPKEEAAMKKHGERADLHADQCGDGGDGGVHRHHADPGLDGEGHRTVYQQNTENCGSNFL